MTEMLQKGLPDGRRRAELDFGLRGAIQRATYERRFPLQVCWRGRAAAPRFGSMVRASSGRTVREVFAIRPTRSAASRGNGKTPNGEASQPLSRTSDADGSSLWSAEAIRPAAL